MYSVRNSCWYYACQLLLWLRFRCCGFQFVKVMPSTCHKTNTYVLIPLAVKEQESMLRPSDHRDRTHRNESFAKFKDGGLIFLLLTGLELRETQRKQKTIVESDQQQTGPMVNTQRAWVYGDCCCGMAVTAVLSLLCQAKTRLWCLTRVLTQSKNPCCD
mgnify:CR=1 FL=1